MKASELIAQARALLKSCRIPVQGPIFDEAVAGTETHGAVAHHAAQLLIHAQALERATETMIAEAVLVGRHLALAEEAQRVKSNMIEVTAEDEHRITTLVNTRDKQYAARQRANEKRAINPPVSEYDEMRASRRTFEEIAAHFGTSEVALRRWRKDHNRL